MTEERILIPEKIYVGVPKQTWGHEFPSMGMSAWGRDSSARSRMETVDRYSVKGVLIDNDPQTGFVIQSAHGDELSISDPRGFSTLVESSYITKLLRNVTLVNGNIMEPCVWARSRGKTLLLTTQSNDYDMAVVQTQVANSKASWKDARPGNRISLTNGLQGIYLGKFYNLDSTALHTGKNCSTWTMQDTAQFVIVKDTNVKHRRKNVVREIFFLSAPKLARIETRDQLTLAESEQLLNQYLRDSDTVQVNARVFMSCVDKFTHVPLMTLETHEFADQIDQCVDCDHNAVVELSNGQGGILTGRYGKAIGKANDQIKLIDMTALKDQSQIVWQMDRHTRGHVSINTMLFDPAQVANVWHIKASYTSPQGNLIERLM
jgi:hypothetical protein